tara:strand:+ start:2104 stop:2529 length:426 start_codon:yes stop_codon:yes gene_type:complete
MNINFNLPTLLFISMTIGLMACEQADGPSRNRITGTVQFDGKPIPYGEIKFTPDAKNGGSGPQGQAMIVDGKFDTAELKKGPTSGPHIIEISGYDGVPNEEMGKWGAPLFFPYKTELSIENENSHLDLKVPPGPKPELPPL